MVEDDVDQGVLLAELLGMVADKVLLSSSAEEAVAIHRRSPVDVVVADMNLAGMSGLDLLRALVAPAEGAPNGRPPGVVLVSGAPGVGPGITALELGATQYLQKPCDPDRLLRLVGEMLAARAEPAREA